MSTENEKVNMAELCMAEMSSQALSDEATPQQVAAMLDKRQSVGRRNIGRLLCEVDSCEAICVVSARDGKIELHRPMSELMNLLGNCVYWNTPESEL